MAERKLLPRDSDDEGSLLSRLGTDSPKPRVKFGGMFCNVEGAYENKTLNFESYNSSPQSVRRHVKIKNEEKCWSDTFSDTGSVSNFSSVSETRPSGDRAVGAETGSSRGQIVYQTGPGHNREHNGKRKVNPHLTDLFSPVEDMLYCAVPELTTCQKSIYKSDIFSSPCFGRISLWRK